MRQLQSDYMHWAKTRSKARYNLATSGVAAFPLRELHCDFNALEINGDSPYGYPPLLSAIAARCSVDPDSVVTAAGTSMANHLAMAAVLKPGDAVLIEHPAYELLVSAALYLGAGVNRFSRLESANYALDPGLIRSVVTPQTRLIVLTNLHNPSSVLTPEPVLREIGDIARSIGARVLVDEVYLDAVYENAPRTAVHLGPEFIVTSSLTKVYGLSGLRCGWILAEPTLARSIWRLNDLFGAVAAYPAELLSVLAFPQLDRIRDRARLIVESDRAALTNFLSSDGAPFFSAVPTPYGTTSFLRLKNGAFPDFLSRLLEQFETSVVPGDFFGVPGHFRIGMGVDHAMFTEGLRRLVLAAGS